MAKRWTIGQMMFWTLFVAMAIPYLLAWLPTQQTAIPLFNLSSNLLVEWTKEIDQSAIVIRGGGGGGNSDVSFDYDYEFLMEFKTATRQEAFLNLAEKVEESLDMKTWNIECKSIGTDKISVFFTNRHFAGRVYVWDIGLNDRDRSTLAARNSNGIRLKVLTIGYSKSHKNLSAGR